MALTEFTAEQKRREMADHMLVVSSPDMKGVSWHLFYNAAQTIPDKIIEMSDDEWVGGFLILYLGQYAWFSLQQDRPKGWTVQ